MTYRLEVALKKNQNWGACQLQNKIISEVGDTVQQIAPGSRKRARNVTKTAFEKLGIAQPKKKRRRKKGKGVVYPSKLLNQFSGQGIILE